jgi:cell division protein FtsL
MADTSRNIMIVVGVVVIGALVYAYATMPDQRTTTEKVGDAVHELPQGLDKASRQLEDRTPGEKVGDAIKDSTEAR